LSVPENLQIEWAPEERVSALFYTPVKGKPGPTLVLGHGAGANQTSPFMVRFATGLATRGIQVCTFNFPYMERGKRTPDPGPKLESCYRSVLRQLRSQQLARSALFVGGKSLGGRIASHLTAGEDDVARDLAGLICLGYPLHPPNAPEKIRSAHLAAIQVPVLIIQGERDVFGRPEEIRAALQKITAPVRLFVVEEGDHSLTVPKRFSLPQEEVYARVEGEIAGWINDAVQTR
jgi:predicted alpha/beta-hydrolase family hydrolase